MDGLFLELGPLKFVSPDKLHINIHSWHNTANMLFIDQPVGTGLSFTKSKSYPTNDKEVNRDLYTAILEFLSLHDRYVTTDSSGMKISRDLYFTGESHAGHYIPSIIQYILQENQKLQSKSKGASSDGLVISVKGAGIGNGWIDPFHQYDASELAHGLGYISKGQLNTMKKKEAACQSLLSSKKYNDPLCFSLLDNVIDATGTRASERMLMYDSRVFSKNTGTGGAFPPGHKLVEQYLNRQDVRVAIHASALPASSHYVECADPPYFALAHQDGLGVTAELAYILEHNLKVLLYSGQYDVVCHHLGTEKLLNALDWTGLKYWQQAKNGIWLDGNVPVGYMKEYKNLQFLVVLNAGHMVPMDQPEVSLSMFNKFINGATFSTGGYSSIAISPDT